MLQMKFEFNILTLDSGVSLKFNYVIREVLEIGETLVVRLGFPGASETMPHIDDGINAAVNRNIFAISKADGKVLWQIATTNDANKYLDNPYAGMSLCEDGTLSVTAFFGTVLKLDPLTGREIGPRGWTK